MIGTLNRMTIVFKDSNGRNMKPKFMEVIAELGPSVTKTFNLLLEQSFKESEIWFSTRANREEIAKKQGISEVRVRQNIKKLIDHKLLIRPTTHSRMEYYVNSKYLGIKLS
jgi:antitoxin component of RelBE/YafQ-DinJ toxin-antitoxin module